MGFPEEIKESDNDVFWHNKILQRSTGGIFYCDRWEGGKTKPNLIAMKNIKEFCLKNDVDYSIIEEAWLDFEVRSKSKW